MTQERGVIAWMATNPVAANLLMLVVMVAGMKALFTIQKEVFPTFPSEMLTITVPYPGSSPEEVERGILVKIEEEIQDIPGIKELRAKATEGSGVVTVELDPGTDILPVLNKVKVRIDGISSFPVDAETPIIEEILSRTSVIRLTISGPVTEASLKELSDDIRDELLALPGITQIEVTGTRAYEISIEISDAALNQYGLQFDDVVSMVRNQSQDLPGGKLRTNTGSITLRSIGQAYTEQEFSDLVLVSNADGTQVKLGDVATVRDEFEDQPVLSQLNGVHGITLRIDRVGDQDVLAISRLVKEYAENKQLQLPEAISLDYWSDKTLVLQSRIDLLLKSALQGIVLVAITLALFLELSLAFWVVAGLPFCILGALFMMDLSYVGLSINVVSLFGFILVLGILVDDAIVTAESAYNQLEKENDGVNSIIRGVKQVAVPTTFGVLTTIFAFLPVLVAEEGIARLFSFAAPVIIFALLLSLIETKLILPSHLRHLKLSNDHASDNVFMKKLRALQARFSGALKQFSETRYRNFLAFSVAHRYSTLAVFVALFMLSLSLVQAGIVRQVFFPSVPSDYISAELTLPQGSSYQSTHNYALRLENAALKLNDRYREKTATQGDVISQILTSSDTDTVASVRIELIDSTERTITSVELAKWWREEIGDLTGIKSFTVDANAGRSSIPVDIELQSDNLEQLRLAAERVRAQLVLFDGVFDVRDTFDAGGPEVNVQIKPQGLALGLGQVELARQVRQAFFGAEIQRIQRGRHEVRVYVRFPKNQRNSLETLDSMWIQLPSGDKVPFDVVGEAKENTGISTINRIDRRRVVNVQADVNKTKIEPGQVLAEIETEILPDILARYPEVRYRFTGEAEEQQKSMAALLIGTLVMLMLIYAALAIPLKSYGQPLLIMLVIPFGLVGAIVGHLLLGQDLSVISIIGIIAMSGIVVNDSLVLVDYINHRLTEGSPWRQAVLEAGERRFRAVILTSVTTFVGLLPIQLETSIQAQFLKPMAISVAFGVLFATVMTLVLVPVLCFIVKDVQAALARIKSSSLLPAAEQ